MAEATFALPPLRQELRLERGAPLPSGAPGWILFDPLRHLFFQLGTIEQQVVAHWRQGEAHRLRDALVGEGHDAEDAEDVIVAFHEFARANQLIERPGAVALAARDAAMRQHWWQWLLDHYLFIRLPLVRPAAFLARTLPWVRPLWQPAGVAALLGVAIIGLMLIGRQWDSFTASFAGLLTPQGIATYVAALFAVKIVHEAGHAYVATRYGCCVPTMGVSFLVMVPVLYTDTSAAWRLRSRRQRMAIAAAGVLAELSVTAICLFLWPFLPDGAIRTTAFILATTSLATTLLVNASPFMRFDGYYLLSDWLNVPNLASRSFALLRWRLREGLFALGESAPECLPAPTRRAMLAYAAITLVYRASLYAGIALLVYHAFFKALGLLLFTVEVFVFLVRPMIREMRDWRVRASAIRASARARWVAAGVVAALVAAFLPLDREVTLPAVLSPIGDRPLVAGDPARVERVLVANGASVAAGQPLVILSAPDITLGKAQAQLRIAQIESRLARGVADREDLADTAVLSRDLATQKDMLAGFERREAALTLRAPVAGRVVDEPHGLAPGDWTDGKTPLARVVTPDRYDVEAYVPEDEAWRLAAGSVGRFVPDQAAAPSWRARVDELGASAIATLDQPVLADNAGGPIAVAKQGERLVPRHALIRLRLVAEMGPAAAFPQSAAGRLVLPANGESLASRIARAIGRVLVRESSIGG